MTKEEAYKLGSEAESILDNPFWKDYPNNPLSEEADFGRWFIEGWINKCCTSP